MYAYISFAEIGASVFANTSNVKVIGGDSVNIAQFPYQVSVQVLEFHACGGSIISKQYILTAAHCIMY